MKVIIAGSRSHIHPEFIRRTLDGQTYFSIEEVVSGGAWGADKEGEDWAKRSGKKLTQFKIVPSDWVQFGKRAGPLRNAKMADYADAAICFWDGRSRGTRNMIDEMKKRGKPCIVIPINAKPAESIP